MNSLELICPVRRLGEGQCPCCYNKLHYLSNEVHMGTLEKNGMVDSDSIIEERYGVYCNKCGYYSRAIQIGLKIIPIDRIPKTDPNWDKKYLEENTLVYGEEGKNPFEKTSHFD